MTKLEIYEKIRYNAEFEETWPDEWPEILSPLCSQEELLGDLEVLYQKMIQYDRDNQDREKRKTLPDYLLREYEVKFCVIAMALGLQGDTSLIPKMLCYVPLDDLMKSPVIIADYVQEEVNRCITNVDYYGEAYIPVLLKHIHELVPDKMFWARSFLWDMVYEDLHSFYETHPLFSNLHLPKKQSFLELLKYCTKKSLDEVEKKDKDKAEELAGIILEPVDSIDVEGAYVLKLAYLRQQFLKLHAVD